MNPLNILPTAVALAFVFQTELLSAPQATSEKPNILFILADDLGKEWIGCYGAEDIETPNIDALAATGMKFQNAYSMPQCTPSRVALLTGTYPFRNGWVNHWDVPRWGVGFFDPKQRQNTTFASLLRDQGYATAAAGKWQINDFRVQPQAMKDHGFDDWLMWTGDETGNPPSTSRYADPYMNSPQGSTTRHGKFGPDLETDHLIAFMQKNRDRPMLLYHAMTLPHTPLIATPDEPRARSPLEKHQAMVRAMDKQVGRLTAALDELGLRERTIIFFTTDNGSTKGITGTRNGEKVKGSKQEMSEAGISPPFIVNAPGRVPAGVETDALTDFTDLLPTFVDLAGGRIPDELKIDGVSLAPVLSGERKDSKRDWILAMGSGPAKTDARGIRGVDDFAPRVIRDKEFKVWVNNAKVIHRLHEVAQDPREENNLLQGTLNERSRAALQKFQMVVDALPDKDARPLYQPFPPISEETRGTGNK